MHTFTLLFLGTCACDFSPKLQTEFKDSFDFDARRSSSALLNGKFLIDCGYHCLDSLRIAGVDAGQITDVLITHLHKDHFLVSNVERLAKGRKTPLRLWVRSDAELPHIENVEVRKMDKKQTYDLGEGMTVKGLLANHDETVSPQHFVFEKNGKRFFYGCDGAWFLHETYYALRNTDLSLMVLDCTCGDYEGDYRMGEHNTIPMLRAMLPSLKTWGVIGENTKTYVSHLAPSLHKPHAETVKIMKELDVKVAYDGLSVE